MDRIIRQITDDLISRLPDDQEAYKTQDLRSCGFPPFLVSRIYVELEDKLAESMMLPQTDWANTGSEAVQQSWQHFLKAIEAEAHLPASFARAVIETAVADTLAVLVQPQKNISDLLFDDAAALSANELAQRCQRLVVYTHFTKVLTSYVKRKELDELQKEHCKAIITRVDTRLTGQYTPLQWAQMLDPLFVLVGKQIDTDLLRLFFEDKKKPRTARKFDLMDATITRAELIEVLSSPDLLNYEGYEPDQSELFGKEREMEDVTGPETDTLSDHFVENEEPDVEKERKDEIPLVEDLPEEDSLNVEEPEIPEPNQAEELSKSKDATKALSDPEEEQLMEPEETVHSLNDIFFSDEGEEPEKAPKPEIDDEQNDEMPLVEDTPQDEPSNIIEPEVPELDHTEANPELQEEEIKQPIITSEEEPFTESKEETAFSLNDMFVGEDEEAEKVPEVEVAEEWDVAENQPETKNGEDGDVPIWQRFVDSDEPAEEDIREEPVPEITTTKDTLPQVNELEIILQDNKSYFVKELFRGSEQRYKSSLQEIGQKESWKGASKLIKDDIFERNNINIYSEAAVDFTDQLQTYFSQR